MTKANHPIGDLGGRSNPITKATLEGGGSKVTKDPHGNLFSIIVRILLTLTTMTIQPQDTLLARPSTPILTIVIIIIINHLHVFMTISMTS
jgi:hypothetical protein